MRRAAEAEAFLAQMLWFRGQQEAVFPHLHAAEALVEGAEPSPGVDSRARLVCPLPDARRGARERVCDVREEALAMAEALVSTTCGCMR